MASIEGAVRDQSPSDNEPLRKSFEYDAHSRQISSDTEPYTNSFEIDGRLIQHPRHKWSKFQFAVIIAAILMSNFQQLNIPQSTAFDASLSASTHVAVASAFNRTNISTWPVNVFYITSMTTQPIYARVSDHVGRKVPYLVASGIFLIGLVLSANAFSWATLVTARAICGLGIAGVMTMGSIILTDAVGVGRRGYYQSLNYLTYGSGSAIGSGIGGLLVQQFGWAWVYKAQIPGAICALLLVISMPSLKISNANDLAASRHPEALGGLRNYDWLGSLCLVLTLVSLFLTLNTDALPWSNIFAIIPMASMVIFTTLFIRVEKDAEKPILPLDLLFKLPTRNILVAGFLFSTINYMIMYTTTIFFQTVRLESMQAAGTRLVIPSMAFSISSVLSGSLIARWKSPAYTLRFSQGLLLVGTSGLVVAAGIFSQHKVPSFIYNIMLILPAIAVGVMAPSTVLTLLNNVNHEEHAVANGSLNMVRALGIFIATALSTATLQNVLNACFSAHNYDAATLNKIKAIRQNVELILLLDEPLRSEVVGSYRRACTTAFNWCTFGALIIALSLSKVKMEAFKKEGSFEMEEAHDEDLV